MRKYHVMASIYGNLLEPSLVQNINPCNFSCHTPIHTITCALIEGLADLFLDRYGEECSQLRGYVYLYTQIGNKWHRITN